MKWARAFAVLGVVLAVATLFARGPTPVEAQTPAFVGQAPSRGSSGLLVVGADSSPGTLIAGLLSAGCETASLAILAGGAWNVYVPGAPAVVNAAFPNALPTGMPFFVRCTERLVTPSAPPAPAAPTPPPPQAVDPSGWLAGSEQGAGTWNLPAGLVLVTFDYQGTGPFTITAEGASEPLVSLTGAGIGAAPLTSTGAPLSLRISGAGPWQVGASTGSGAFAESPGGYACVDAASWVEVPPDEGDSVPANRIWIFACDGFDVSPPVHLDGTVLAIAWRESGAEFHAWLIDQQGNPVAELFNTTGALDEKTGLTRTLPGGVYRLVVQTEGDWVLGLGEIGR